jgi:aspartate/methionine/tyrosine aminotransferase
MLDAGAQPTPSREAAAAALYDAANQYSHVAGAIALRHATIEMLRDRQAALHEAALAYAAACGWQPPTSSIAR